MGLALRPEGPKHPRESSRSSCSGTRDVDGLFPALQPAQVRASLEAIYTLCWILLIYLVHCNGPMN